MNIRANPQPQLVAITRGPHSTSPSSESSEMDAKLKKAATDFEGLLLSQMLQSIRESALGGWQENHDQGGAVALEMAETQLAQVMASQGGLGIARTLTESMKHRRPEIVKEGNESGG